MTESIQFCNEDHLDQGEKKGRGQRTCLMALGVSRVDRTGLADEGRAEVAPPQIRLVRSTLLGLAGSTLIVVGALLGGSSFETHLPGAWFFGMQGGHLGSLGSDSTLPTVVSLILVFGGLILLTRVWLGLLRQLSAHRGVPVKRIVGVVVIWAIPMLLAPPLFSRDVYSYAGQGEMVSHHIDPYSYGPGVLGSTPFSTLPDEVWSNTPTPYGPTFLTIDGVLDKASDHQILTDVVLLRLLELAGIALIVAATPTLARALRRDPAHAILIGAGSPLVLTSLVAGAHNDALMAGLLLAGLAVARRFGTVPGIILCALAAGVKSPAILGVLFLGWVWAGPGASFRRRVAHAAMAGLLGAVVLEVMGLLSGFGWGWIRSSTAADKSFTGVTPIDALSRAVSLLGHVVDLQISVLGLRTAFSIAGLLCAAAIGVVLLLRSPVEGVTRCLGLSLLAVALLGPILWAWYATWGILVLAPALALKGRLRTFVIGLGIFETFVGVTSLHNVAKSLYHGGVFPDLFLLGVILAIAIVPLGQFRSRTKLMAAMPPWDGAPDAGSDADAQPLLAGATA
jgi:alpha-1,6-mannosyltransferase